MRMFQRTMSMTKATKAITHPTKAKMDIKMVATLDAAAAPRIPERRANKAKKPAIGCRTRVYVRLCRTLELRFTLLSSGSVRRNTERILYRRTWPHSP